MAWALFIGLNAAFWGTIGIARYSAEAAARGRIRDRIALLRRVFHKALNTDRKSIMPDMRAALVGGTSGALFFTVLVTFDTESFFRGSFPDGIFLTTGFLWVVSATAAGFLAGTTAASHGRPKQIIGSGITAGAVLALVELLLAFLTLTGLDPLATTIRLSTLVVIFTLAITAIAAGASGGYLAHIAVLFLGSPLPRPRTRAPALSPRDVCSLTAAHNEEHTIGRTLSSLKRILPAKNIYVASDASSDETVAIVREAGANVIDIWPNKGKANALAHALREYRLIDRYKALMIVDADSEVGEQYLEQALPFFDDPNTAAVAVHAMSKWRNHRLPERRFLYAAYRIRLYRVLQAVFRYGQTWGSLGFSFTPIIPGFASIYRTSVVKKLEINAPGLVIEDFNMTFEVHRKKLGRIAYSPRVTAVSQDPLRLKDYVKQVRRWNLGFWQTVFRNGVWMSGFWLTLAAFLFELIVVSLLTLALPFLTLALLFEPGGLDITLPFPPFGLRLALLSIGIGILVSDIAVTAIVAAYERKPVLLLYAPAFIVLRYIDTYLFLSTFFLALRGKSTTGVWVSPKRQTM